MNRFIFELCWTQNWLSKNDVTAVVIKISVTACCCMELWVLGMDRNLCDRWSLRLEVCRSLQACNSSLFSVQNNNNCCSAVRSIPMHGSYWRTMADNLAYQRKNNSSICHLCPELYEHFLHRLLHPSTFFHFSYFHQFISFLIHRLRNTCDFFMKIEHYVGKVDLLTVFSIPLIYLKKKSFNVL